MERSGALFSRLVIILYIDAHLIIIFFTKKVQKWVYRVMYKLIFPESWEKCTRLLRYTLLRFYLKLKGLSDARVVSVTKKKEYAFKIHFL